MPIELNGKYWSTVEIAEEEHVDYHTAFIWVKSGVLRSVRFGRDHLIHDAEYQRFRAARKDGGR